MTPSAAIRIEAIVAAGEQAAVRLAADRLAAALDAVQDVTTEVVCTFDGDDTSADLVLTSFGRDAEALDVAWPAVEAGLRARHERLAQGPAPVFICTVFRYVAESEPAELRARLIRIRRLNLLAAEISRELGAFVIDLDRDLADAGGLALDSDYRLTGAAAVETAARSIALAVISYGLDARVAFEAQDDAKAQLVAWRPAGAVAGSQRLTMNQSSVIAWGKGRRRQTVATTVDTVQENHVALLLLNLLRGRIGLGFAASKLAHSFATRGPRRSLARLAQGLGRLLRSYTEARP